MDTKYLITAHGRFAIFSSFIGAEHADIARILDAAPSDLVGAGFCTINGGLISAYGKSLSTGVNSRPVKDGAILTKALADGSMMIATTGPGRAFATNDATCFLDSAKMYATVELLHTWKIFK